MSDTTPTKHGDILRTQSNAEETPKETYSNEQLEGTPFYIHEDPKLGWFITMGKYRLTQPKPTKEEAIEELEKNKWLIMTNIAAIVHENIAAETMKLYNEKEPLKKTLKNLTNKKGGL